MFLAEILRPYKSPVEESMTSRTCYIRTFKNEITGFLKSGFSQTNTILSTTVSDLRDIISAYGHADFI